MNNDLLKLRIVRLGRVYPCRRCKLSNNNWFKILSILFGSLVASATHSAPQHFQINAAKGRVVLSASASVGGPAPGYGNKKSGTQFPIVPAGSLVSQAGPMSLSQANKNNAGSNNMNNNSAAPQKQQSGTPNTSNAAPSQQTGGPVSGQLVKPAPTQQAGAATSGQAASTSPAQQTGAASQAPNPAPQ
jgi:hypothetical protein